MRTKTLVSFHLLKVIHTVDKEGHFQKYANKFSFYKANIGL